MLIDVILSYDSSTSIDDLAVVLAHEGAHVAHVQQYGWELANAFEYGGAGPSGTAVDLTDYEGERQAYNVSAFAAEALGFSSYHYGPEGNRRVILLDGAVQEDQIDAWISDLYGLTRDEQGMRLSSQIRR